MFLTDSSHRNVRRSIIVFAGTGLLFFVYSVFNRIDHGATLSSNPLYYHGAAGILLAMVGGVFAGYCYRGGEIPLLRIALLSFVLSLLWLGGVVVIGSNLRGDENVLASAVWIGLLTLLFFMGVGAINGLLGSWITMINAALAGYTLLVAHTASPAVWVSVLDLVGVHNPWMQWALLLMSSFMGISEKGVELLNLDG